MSQAARSKSKDKKVSKEPLKVASKPSSANAGVGVPTSGYNPLLGTFHALDTAPGISSAAHFRNIDETDDLSGHSHGTGEEYETVPNNGSELEDHKEKTSNLPLRQESFLGADNDKHEKIRQKNERKHQRQKERRAQELHEKCSGYLMSRKREALADQLVSMGFSSEQATMALILNEGRVEQSVAWLLEEGEEANKDEEQSLDNGGNLKIDISEEVARMADMEIRYRCSKQDAERAVVTCEGNLEKAEDPEETSDPPIMSNDKLPIGATQNSARVPVKPSSSSTIPAKKDDKDFSYTKVVATAGPSTDPGSKNIPLVERAQPKLEWVKTPQVSVPVDKRLPNPGSNPFVSYSLSSSLQASPPPTKTEAHYVAVGNKLENRQIGTAREPVIVLQRPHSVNARHPPTSNVSSSLPGTAAPSYPNNVVGTVTPHGMIPQIPVTRSLSMNSVSTNQVYNQLRYQQLQQPEQFVSSYGTLKSAGVSLVNTLWSRTGGASQTQPVAPGSSLGLFSGVSSNATYGLPSPVDWSTGGGDSSVLHVDYTNIDWSLDSSSSSPGTGGIWTKKDSTLMHFYNPKYDPFYCGLPAKPTERRILPNEVGVPVPQLQDGASISAETSATGASRVWTSPFEEKDLFSLSRQFVSSPLSVKSMGRGFE
ncbi:unnamed protein product [Withania somnifera]